jgi:hypothetical protein
MKRIFNKDMTALAALSTKGCYIYASLTALSRAKVRDFLVANLMDTELEFLKLSDTTELHVTLMYSNRNPSYRITSKTPAQCPSSWRPGSHELSHGLER